MPALTHSQRLRQKIELVMPDFIEASTDLVSHPNFRELYPEMLIRMHWMIRASIDIMTLTMNRSRELAATDPVCAGLVPYFEQHIKEEMDHDDWLLEDLELMGVNRADVLKRMPSATAAACVGARYYWVLNHHPVAELGALAVMEGYPASIEAIDMMQEVTGWPRAAFRTIEKHAHLDIHHRDEMLEMIDGLPLDDVHHEIIGTMAFHIVETASALYREVVEQADQAAELAVAS